MTVSSYSAVFPSLLTSLAYKQKTLLLINDSAPLILQLVLVFLDESNPFCYQYLHNFSLVSS